MPHLAERPSGVRQITHWPLHTVEHRVATCSLLLHATTHATSWRERLLAVIAFLCALFGALLCWGLVFGPARVDAKGIFLTGLRETVFIVLLAFATVAALCGSWWAWRGAPATRLTLLPIGPLLALSAWVIERSLPDVGRPVAFSVACGLAPALLVWWATRRASSIE